MKYLFSLVVGVFLLASGGCTKDPVNGVDDTIAVRAKATYGGQPLVMYNWVDYPQGFKIRFQTVDIMIKGFGLNGPGKTIHTLDTVFVLNFTDTAIDEAGAKRGILKRFDNNEGSFSFLNFGIGVDSLINNKMPSDFPSSSVLSNTYYHWDAWDSYIFMKIEGQYDTDGDGNYDGTFTYHTGKTNLYKLFSLPVNLNAQKGSVNEIVLNFDVKNILAADGDYIDVVKNPTSHKVQDLPILEKIFEHLSKAVTVN